MGPRSVSIRYLDAPRQTADLVIVGGGVVGCATAFFAAREGIQAVVVERRPALATLTTPASTGAFRLQFDNLEEIALVREGVELFERFEERTGLPGWDVGLRKQGYLFAARTEASATRARELVERQHRWGLDDIELLTGDEARRRFPYLAPGIVGARFRAGDGWLDPLRLVHGYATAASTGGAAFVMSTTATGFHRDGDRITGVETDRGGIDAGAVVIAAGPFSGRVAALAGVDLPIAPTLRQKLVYRDLPDVPQWAPMTIDEETAAHWRPHAGGALCLWTDSGAAASDPLEQPTGDERWARGLLDPSSDHALAHVAPFWRTVWERGTEAYEIQAGQYEYTPDRRPLLGPSGLDGLHLNAGYSGHGVMASAGGSRIVVDLLIGRSDASANPFRVGRPMPERPLDIL